MIKLYSSSACTHCRVLREELAEKGIDYEYMDLDDKKIEEEARELCRNRESSELPIVVKDGKVFNRPSINDLI